MHYNEGQILQSHPYASGEKEIIDVLEVDKDLLLIVIRHARVAPNTEVKVLKNGQIKNDVLLDSIATIHGSGLSNTFVNKMDKSVWLSSSGLIILNKELNVQFKKPYREWGIRRINQLIVDRQNTVWIASQGGLRMVQFKPSPFQRYLHNIPQQRKELQKSSWLASQVESGQALQRSLVCDCCQLMMKPSQCRSNLHRL